MRRPLSWTSAHQLPNPLSIDPAWRCSQPFTLCRSRFVTAWRTRPGYDWGSVAQFEAALSKLNLSDATFLPSSEITSWDAESRACVQGLMESTAGDRGVEVYLVQSGDGVWQVEEWAVDQPRAMQKLHIIDACR